MYVVNECCDKNNVQNTYTLRRLSRAKLFALGKVVT